MMDVLAFSCAHICTRNTQMYLYGHVYDYRNLEKLLAYIEANKPDAVVNLGDWEETWYETPGLAESIVPELVRTITHILRGNHDREGLNEIILDGIKYVHGTGGRRDHTIEEIRAIYAEQKLVHGHTHQPKEMWPLDVGSITFTGTFGMIRDGVATLEKI